MFEQTRTFIPGEFVQTITPRVRFSVDVIAKPGDEYELSTYVTKPFDYNVPPLLRGRIVMGEREHTVEVQLVCPSIVLDGHSIGAIMRELAEVYAGFLQDQGATEATFRQYPEYAAWEASELARGTLRHSASMWVRHNAEQTCGIKHREVPFARSLADDESFAAKVYEPCTFEETTAVTSCARYTELVFGLTAVARAFGSIIKRDQVSLWVTFPNRSNQPLKGTIGPLAQRHLLTIDSSGRDPVQRVEQMCAWAIPHARTPRVAVAHRSLGQPNPSDLFFSYTSMPPVQLGPTTVMTYLPPLGGPVERSTLDIRLLNTEGFMKWLVRYNLASYAEDGVRDLARSCRLALVDVALASVTRPLFQGAMGRGRLA
jgi:hypothetical protein